MAEAQEPALVSAVHGHFGPDLRPVLHAVGARAVGKAKNNLGVLGMQDHIATWADEFGIGCIPQRKTCRGMNLHSEGVGGCVSVCLPVHLYMCIWYMQGSLCIYIYICICLSLAIYGCANACARCMFFPVKLRKSQRRLRPRICEVVVPGMEGTFPQGAWNACRGSSV